ncbi:MAG: hypothetical protein GXO27_04055 [Chlorobi bacterium]|nr:hypothetical protein [Chlorobiota bacterium]
MDSLTRDWTRVQAFIRDTFGTDSPDLPTVLYLIGVQELGRGFENFSRDDKLNLMHIGACTVLEPYGYCRRKTPRPDGWPDFDILKKIPPEGGKEYETLMLRAVADYFKRHGLI